MVSDSKDKLKEITDKLTKGLEELFESNRYREYLQTMSKFHSYSFSNTLLISIQNPQATYVAGFNKWKELGRNVKKGQKGIKIIAPLAYKKVESDSTNRKIENTINSEDENQLTNVGETVVNGYKAVTVFDISQTEGKALPNIRVDALGGDVENYDMLFDAILKTSPVDINFESIPGAGHGYYNLVEKKIAIDKDMSELQNMKTAIHEIAYAKLREIDLNATNEELQNLPDRSTREVEAESIAYIVCEHYGLDTSDYSFGYIAGWSNGKELAELKNSLKTIQSTAAEIINSINGHIAELQKEQIQTAEQEQPTAAAHTEPEQTAAVKPTIDEQSDTPQPTTAQETPPATPYYSINETAARRAKEAMSFSDYKPGSATAEYHHYVDEAAELAAQQKKRVDPMYHEKIDSLLDTYARKLAANMNKGYEIAGRVPSIMIAGGSNFPVRKKEKQNAAADRNMEEWQDIQGLLDKIRSTGTGGISADDPQAVQKLENKLAGLEKSQETMKAVNAYYRKHKTLDGCPHLSPGNIEKLKASMERGYHLEGKPYPTWELSNNSAEIRRVKERIKSLSQRKEIGYAGWEFAGGKVEANTEANRLQIFFDEKPGEAVRADLKAGGFRWSPKEGAWQRQLTDNAYFATNYIKAIAPLTGERPTDLQREHIRAEKSKPQEAAQPKIQEQSDVQAFAAAAEHINNPNAVDEAARNAAQTLGAMEHNVKPLRTRRR